MEEEEIYPRLMPSGILYYLDYVYSPASLKKYPLNIQKPKAYVTWKNEKTFKELRLS
jgi:hypothetical protein